MSARRLDPYLTDPKTPVEYKKLEALGKVDLVLVSRDHLDYRDGVGLTRG